MVRYAVGSVERRTVVSLTLGLSALANTGALVYALSS